MFHNKMVLAIKSNGKVLREFGEEVRIPFGSEYSLLIKNLNTVRAIVNVYIDSTNVVPGGLVVNANSEIDLERYLNNGNMNAGNKFKFVERTQRIEDTRGIKAEDGIVKIEYRYEIFPTYTPPVTTWTSSGDWYNKSTILRGAPIGGVYNDGPQYMTTSAVYSANAVSAQGIAMNASVETKSYTNDVGITVPGGVSDQKFTTVGWFPTETQAHTIILRLVGQVPGQKIKRAVTVKTKAKCTTCGHLNKATAKFCSECGTGLVLV